MKKVSCYSDKMPLVAKLRYYLRQRLDKGSWKFKFLRYVFNDILSRMLPKLEVALYTLKDVASLQINTEKAGHLIYSLLGWEAFYRYLRHYYFDESNRCFHFHGIRIPDPGQGKIRAAFLTQYFQFIYPEITDHLLSPLEGPYEYGEVRLERGDVVIDAGASAGFFSALAASRGCRVYAFEPVPETCEYLRRTTKLNPGISVVEAALTDKDGNTVMFESENAIDSTLIKNPSARYIREFNVLGLRLDTFVKENNIAKVDFIKADIEGAERFMLCGARSVLAEHQPKLAICTYHHPDDPIVLKNLILQACPDYIVREAWLKLYAYVLKEARRRHTV